MRGGGLGAAVLQFSRDYLDGDERQGAFLGDLALTVGVATRVRRPSWIASFVNTSPRSKNS